VHYRGFAAACRAVEEPGLVVVAIDEATRRVDGILTLRARLDGVAAAVIGRHTGADLYLAGDEAVSLRHLAVLVEPVRSFRRGPVELGYRILDLRTELGLVDEEGRILRGARCEGSAFFRCGSYALFFLVVGDPTDFPESAHEAWAFVPDRVLLDQPAWRPGTPRIAALATGTRNSLIVRTPGPAAPARFRGPGDDLAGTLETCDPGSRMALPIGKEALREGVLCGRYARCDGSELFTHRRVSRVHLLLVEMGGDALAIDTGTTNGTTVDGRPIRRVHALVSGEALTLGSAEVTLRWLPRAPTGPSSSRS
jgi:hypothetical protein